MQGLSPPSAWGPRVVGMVFFRLGGSGNPELSPQTPNPDCELHRVGCVLWKVIRPIDFAKLSTKS